jgi:SAM-dependent methyltransferase
VREPFSYDAIADGYAAEVDRAPYNALYERPATLALLPPVAGAHVLDAGCGSGWYAEQLLTRGAAVTAIDGSARMVEHARARIAALGALSDEASIPLPGRARVRTADLRLPLDFLADASVDGVVSALVLHYLRDWGPTLRELRRVLRSDGWLVLSTHHPADEAARLDVPDYFAVEEYEDDWQWLGTVRYWRRPLTATVEALADAGFAVERLVEPLPTEAFRAAKPDAYARLRKRPGFLLVRARPWPVGRS